MAQFQIRPARDDDAVAIAQAHVDARRVAMPWLPVIHTVEETVRFFGDFVIPNQVVLVAEAEEGVVGFIAIEGSFVEHLYIAPSHQGIGIGEALLDRAKELRPEGLMLWTFEATIAREGSTRSAASSRSSSPMARATRSARPMCGTIGTPHRADERW